MQLQQYNLLKFTFAALLHLFIFNHANSQQTIHQDIKGVVTDNLTNSGIPGVKITLVGTDILTVTDSSGHYIINQVPLGIYNLQFSSIGYESKLIDNQVVTTAKQLIVNIQLTESSKILGTVTISSNQIGEPINPMANVSARSINIQNTQKFPGSIGDVSRIVTAYAGINGAPYSSFNFITVRGNSSTGVKYQLNGVEMLNPNHLSVAGSSAGFISVINMNALNVSDFYSSAFPAEFFNATSSVFDLKLKNGNLTHRENSITLSFLGLDFFSEGPIKKGKSSYLINYRYSTFGLIDKLTPLTGIPKYQDLTINLFTKTKGGGKLNTFFIGGLSGYDFRAKLDSTEWDVAQDRTSQQMGSDIGLFGLTFQKKISEKSNLKSTLSFQVGRNYHHSRYLLDNFNFEKRDSTNHLNLKTDLHTYINTKFSPRHYNKTGVRITNRNMNLFNAKYNPLNSAYDTLINSNHSSFIIAAYTQSKFDLTDKNYILVGLNGNYNTLSKVISIEPRLGFNHKFSPKTKMNFGAGLYSKHEHELVYFSNNVDHLGNTFPSQNMSLKPQKSLHIVLGIDQLMFKKIRLKNEIYYQHILASPASTTNGFAMLNYHQYDFPHTLNGNATGENYGLETTLEGYYNLAYFIISGTIFDSKYTDHFGIKRNTTFNTNNAVNIVLGKDFKIGKRKHKNNLISSNLSFSYTGGRYYTPVDLQESINFQKTIYDYDQINTLRRSPTVRLDMSFSYQYNKPKYTGKFFMQIKNLYSNRVVTYDYFDVINQDIKEFTDFGLIPVLGMQFDF